MADLFSRLTLRGLTLRNRILMPPMCMYSADTDGIATDWHLSHYHARARGGVGLILMEATAVEPRGRISINDLGLWDDAQVAPLSRMADLVHAEGAAFGVQLAHAGRKAWSAERGFGPETPVAPSAVAYNEESNTPHALTVAEIDVLVEQWQRAAQRAEAAGLDVIEIHGAHGYLLHEFLSPLSNHRTDEYGGDLSDRMRLLLRVVDAVRAVWPADKPIFVRLSAVDWVEGGLTLDDTVVIARALREHGVALVHCSGGGMAGARPPAAGPGYMIPFAERVRREANVPTAAVGLITAPELADAVIRNAQADLVALGRELLRHPHWPLDAARALGHDIAWPKQYQRAK
ncbi:MAG TPA: NADPH dehydrogenase NamA [Anaerolineae bacterium]|nr:NADPH dehydrogenase NamA [Anaerolineae bacterium]HQI84220.1 NADPH dehydrogenase NamA [Anaerolineae bacterium]